MQDKELIEKIAYYCEENDQASLYDYIMQRDAAKERQADFKLVLFGAELGYCLANGLPVGEGHTPPSFVYESMEGTVEKWLSKRRESDQAKEEDFDE